jgi:hypothetical protein
MKDVFALRPLSFFVLLFILDPSFVKVPAEFDQGAPLISVDLSLNFITEISYRIAFLSSVTILNLSKNNIARLHPGLFFPILQAYFGTVLILFPALGELFSLCR